MMRLLLWRPASVGEWVAGSFLSAVGLLGLWWVAGNLLWFGILTHQAQGLQWVGKLLDLVVPTALVTHGLLWWQVLRGGWALAGSADRASAWPLAGAVLWLLVLLGFQLLCLLLGYALVDPTPTASTPWLQF